MWRLRRKFSKKDFRTFFIFSLLHGGSAGREGKKSARLGQSGVTIPSQHGTLRFLWLAIDRTNGRGAQGRK
jgi:hypothetical protein